MSYNPTYGGQFRGLQASTQRSTGGSSAGGGKAAGSPAAGASGGSTEPGEKVIVTLGGLKQVQLDEIKEGDERHFIVVGLFEGDDLNSVVNRTRNRTKPIKGQVVAGKYTCSFAGEKIVLPVTQLEKRLLLYICAVTIQNEETDGKIFKNISLMGIGFSQPFEVCVCKKYPHSTIELRLVDGGDPSINPGKLEVTVEVCKGDTGAAIPEDKEEYIMNQFQN